MKRPLIRYHGGKWKLANWIVAHLPLHRVYVEPFAGGASVLLKKPRSPIEVINDRCSDVTNLFTIVRDRGDELRRRLELTPFSRDEFLLSYQESIDPLERARRMIVRSAMGRASGSASKGNVQTFRAYTGPKRPSTINDWINFPAALDDIVERLRGVFIENRDALLVMKAHDYVDTVHYVDPPYVRSARDNDQDYRYEMSDSDHESLLTFVKTLRGTVVISGYESDLYNDMLAGWGRSLKETHADGANKRIEMLWISPRCEQRMEAA